MNEQMLSRHRLQLPGQLVHWLVVVAFLAVPFAASQRAAAQTPPVAGDEMLPAGPLGEQIGWMISAANGNVDVSDPRVIAAHFSPAFLQDLGINGLMSFAYGLIRTYSPVTLVSVTPNADGTAAVTMLTAADGTPLRFTVAIDPETGQISGLEIVPANQASPEASPLASPMASPVAAAVAPPTWAEIGDDYTATVAAIQKSGRQAAQTFIAGDIETLTRLFAPGVQLQVDAAQYTAAYTNLMTNRVHFAYAGAGAIFDGHVADGEMEGFLAQGALTRFQLTAAAQTSDVPTGRPGGAVQPSSRITTRSARSSGTRTT